jgi:hypothetical protein
MATERGGKRAPCPVVIATISPTGRACPGHSLRRAWDRLDGLGSTSPRRSSDPAERRR